MEMSGMNTGKGALIVPIVVCFLLAICVPNALSAGKKYPAKPVKLICAYGAGGATDIAARAIASTIQLGQPVIVTNMPGAGGAVGFDEVRKSDPDGYKLLTASIGGNAILFALNTTLPFKYDELTFIARTQINPNALIVNSKSTWKTFNDFADSLKKNPGKYKYSTASAGGIQHLGPIIMMKEIGLKASAADPIHFDSDNEAVLAVVRGNADFYQGNYNATVSALKGGLVRCLAVTTPKRLDVLKDVPTFAELGYPNINVVGWRGICGPPGLPQPIVKLWEEAVYKACNSKSWLDIVTKLGDEPGYMNSETFKNFVIQEFSAYRTIFTDLGMLIK